MMNETKPIRLQRSRRKGAKLESPNGLPVVCVTRPGRFGNPYLIQNIYRGLVSDCYDFSGVQGSPLCFELHHDFVGHFRGQVRECIPDGELCARIAVELFKKIVAKLQAKDPERFAVWIAPLRGKNLACWCKLGAPCHADVLLELANAPLAQESPC